LEVMEMADNVSPVPRGYRTVTPCLTVNGIDQAVAFYQAAFGAEEKVRLHGADGAVVHAELKIGNSVVFLNEEDPTLGIFSPASLGASPTLVHLYVQDVDAAWSRAIAAGATEVVPLVDTYWGDRFGKLADLSGHIWSVASRVERVSRNELIERAKVATQPQPLCEALPELAA
jgi:PhnB protein